MESLQTVKAFDIFENVRGSENTISEESTFLQFGAHHLHLKRFFANNRGTVAFLLHGLMGNGRTYYSRCRQKGFAIYLARQGYDVFVPDLRGRGLSEPTISKDINFGISESICEDLPIFLEAIIEKRGRAKQHWVGHSYGGTLLLSFFARFPKYHDLVDRIALFGSYRYIEIKTIKNWFFYSFLRDFFFFRLANKVHGYFPAQVYGAGTGNETLRVLEDLRSWQRIGSPWIDTRDGFNYGEEIKKYKLPALLFLLAGRETFREQWSDVRRFISEIGAERIAQTLTLGEISGCKKNYDHVEMLTHPNAPTDQFPLVNQWLQIGKISR